jgi:nitric oxide reductase activation protein
VTRHDEWDRHLRAYRRAWTAVHQRRLEGTDLGWIDALHSRFPSLSQRIRRRFARVSADGLVRERRMSDGERFDMDAVIDALVARRAGSGGAGRPAV